eukprot:TRINITY_DN72321_c0_g1_i1.p1 TRINITY_DN72321_c0_g1~~TRINITY_DN72321_c0_g1_i1.p1  ORF type:complete len:275 (+),score=67.23 TRINITY_DN72321_c0_g1_i1:58-882(+)
MLRSHCWHALISALAIHFSDGIPQTVITSGLNEIDAQVVAVSMQWQHAIAGKNFLQPSVVAPVKQRLTRLIAKSDGNANKTARAETKRQRDFLRSLQNRSRKATAGSAAVVARAAKEYAHSRTQNAAATAVAPMVDESLQGLARAEALRVEAATFAHATALAANASAKVAKEAKAVAANVTREEALRALEIVEAAQKEAEGLREESENAARIAQVASKVAGDVSRFAAGALARAKAAEATATKALDMAEANGKRLSNLHTQAQGAEEHASSMMR